MKLLAAGWDDIIELTAAAKRPADPGSHFGRIYPGIEATQDKLARFGIGLEHRLVGYDLRGSCAGDAQLRATPAFGSEPRARDKVDAFRKDPPVQAADNHSAARVNCDLRRASTSGQTDNGVAVVSDDGGVDVPVAVDLGAAQQADLNPSILKEALKDISHAADHEGSGDQRGITDRNWEALGDGSHGARLVDQNKTGRVGRAGEIAGQVRESDADEHHFTVTELPSGDHGHHLGRRVTQLHRIRLPRFLIPSVARDLLNMLSAP